MNNILIYTQNNNDLIEPDLENYIMKIYDDKIYFPKNIDINNQKYIRKKVSKYTKFMPLYEIKYNRIHLICMENIFERINNENYRFITKELKQKLNDENNMRILEFYDLKLLNLTYYRIFYESYQLANYVTECRRPSFYSGISHIKPYYSMDELYYLAIDWNLVEKPAFSNEQVSQLCKQICKYDIDADTLLNHQYYIYNLKNIGLVKHYSLYGSYYINNYLRIKQTYKNSVIENQINSMIKLIKNAPGFKKSHTVYRFITEDFFIDNLKEGDIYEDPSFMSTTRNPFKYQDIYNFGYILLKIKIPEGYSGIGLCIESYSNFPDEEEIILPPFSKYKLIRKITKEQDKYQNIMKKRVLKKYEFELLYEKNNKLFNSSYIIPAKKYFSLDNFSNQEISYYELNERPLYFKNNYLNEVNMFYSLINNKEYIFSVIAYDSSNAYKDFFYYETKNGLLITSTNPKFGNVNLLIEIGPDIHINYYFKHSLNDSSIATDLDSDSWIEWFCLLSYFMGTKNVYFYPSYDITTNENDTIEEKNNKIRYNIMRDIYDYLKYNKKRFSKTKYNNYIETTFEYYDLDKIKIIRNEDLLLKTDLNELYYYYKETELEFASELLIYFIENRPEFVNLYLSTISKFMNIDLVDNLKYKMNPWFIMLNNNYVKQIPSETQFANNSYVKSKKISGLEKFKNRLRNYI